MLDARGRNRRGELLFELLEEEFELLEEELLEEELLEEELLEGRLEDRLLL